MVLVVTMYAGNILVGKAINDLPPLTITFFRLFVAFIVLFPIGYRSAWRYRSKLMTYKKPILIMTFTGITFFNTFIYAALRFTTTANISVLEASIPVATIILSVIMLNERLARLVLSVVFISLLGAIWVILDGKILQLFSMKWTPGEALMLGAIISWAIYSIYVKKYNHLFPPFGSLLVMTG